MIIPFVLFLSPAVIAGPSDDGTIKIKSNVSFSPSNSLSSITGTLTLLIVIPLSNVAVNVVVSKSMPPVSQTLFSQHIIIHITLLPSAETGDCSDGTIVTLNELLDIPPTSSNVITTNPVASEPVYCACVNPTLTSTIKGVQFICTYDIFYMYIYIYTYIHTNIYTTLDKCI